MVDIYWNYRILKRVEAEGTENEETSLHVVEAYYQDNGNLLGWTKDGCVYAEDLAELRNTLELMLESLDKPIYVEADLLAEAVASREIGAENIFPTQGVTITEVADSLGLELEDIDTATNLSSVVTYLEPSQIEESGESNLPLMVSDTEIEDTEMGRYPAKVNRPSDRPPVPGPTYPEVPLTPEPAPEELARWDDNGGGNQ